jgi:hypothetical protein
MDAPSAAPTAAPTALPTPTPSSTLTAAPTDVPSPSPTDAPTAVPTAQPTDVGGVCGWHSKTKYRAICDSVYINSLKRWTTFFDPEQFLLLSFNEVIHTPKIALAAIAKHIGFDEGVQREVSFFVFFTYLFVAEYLSHMPYILYPRYRIAML